MNYLHQNFFILLLGFFCLFGCQKELSTDFASEQNTEALTLRTINIVDYQLDGDDRVAIYEWQDTYPGANYEFQFTTSNQVKPFGIIGTIPVNARLSNKPTFDSEFLTITVLSRTSCAVRLKGNHLKGEELVAKVLVSQSGARIIKDIVWMSSSVVKETGGASVVTIGLPPELFAGACAGTCNYYTLNLGVIDESIFTKIVNHIGIYKREDICDCVASTNVIECLYYKPSYLISPIYECSL